MSKCLFTARRPAAKIPASFDKRRYPRSGSPARHIHPVLSETGYAFFESQKVNLQARQSLQPSAKAIETLQTLIAFDTTSRDSNLGLIEWVRDQLARSGAQCRLTYNKSRNKANLFATIGEGAEGGLVLSGHTDVVPVDGQPWSSDPFRAEIRDGKIYGRGACDMKGFIACVLATLAQLQAGRTRPPLHLAFSYDEEVGCRGVRELLADLQSTGVRPGGCIVGEPTQMGVVIAHKGRREMRCEVKGQEAHSSMPNLGVNAIEYAGEIISLVRRLARREAQTGERDGRFDLPHSTMLCTLVKGGIAPNVVPRDCEFSVDMRYLASGKSLALFDELQRVCGQELLAEMTSVTPEAAINWTLTNDTPGLDMPADHPFVSWAMRHAKVTGAQMLALGTEAGLFQRAGIPTVVCGPGNIAQAHKPDEFIELAQLARCEEFLRGLGSGPRWPEGSH